MSNQLLKDENIYPTPEIIRDTLGEAYPVYEQFLLTLAETFPGMAIDWRYYKDGKAWLGKCTAQKKTVFWLSVWEGSFKVSFYFTEITSHGAMVLEIAEEHKKRLQNAAMVGKLVPLIFDISEEGQLADLFAVMKYKAALK